MLPEAADAALRMPTQAACGALISPRSKVQMTISALDERGWRKKRTKIAPHAGKRVIVCRRWFTWCLVLSCGSITFDLAGSECLAISVLPVAASALDAAAAAGWVSAEIPSRLLDLLQHGTVQWLSGARVGTDAALAHSQEQCPVTPRVCLQDPQGGMECTESPKSAFTYVELFAGIGGFRLALDSLGGRCVFASEIDPHATETYRANFGHAPAGDITEVPSELVPTHDILCGGFPCQARGRTATYEPRVESGVAASTS